MFFLPTVQYRLTIALYAYLLACEVLETLVFIAVTLELARYTPIEPRLLYCFTRVGYATVATVAFFSLLYVFSLFFPSMRYVHLDYLHSLQRLACGISTSILLAASMVLKARSNPQRSESKVQISITTSGIAFHNSLKASNFFSFHRL